jgi:hypothetical protein
MHAKDVYHAAKLVLEQYGADAPARAAMMAETMKARGDVQGWSVWQRIGVAINALRSIGGGTTH